MASDNERDGAGSRVDALEIPLERDVFLRALLGHLAGTLEEVVGLEEALGFISVVGQKMGMEIGQLYRDALDQQRLSGEQLGPVLIDLKRRIHGDFALAEESGEKLVFVNRRCPFGDKVVGHPSLCMMTSNVFGSITAATNGYARVDIEEAIARGQDGCRVVVYLKQAEESTELSGREYFES